jgi:glycerophosphoryl diester phosphodiesterase
MALRILGHRGASADFPENTIEAFQGAAAQGADGVELDIMRCGSDELVACHDERLDRLAGTDLRVSRTSWRRLKSVDVGSRLGFAPARIPSLDEVVDALPERLVLNLELKCDGVDDLGLSEAVGARIIDRRLIDRTIVSSFNPLCLVRLARAFPQVKRGLLLDPDKAWLPQAWLWLPVIGPSSVHPAWSQCTPSRAARWHAANLELMVWTVDDVEEARRLRAMGVEWLITNRPGRLRTELDSVAWVASRTTAEPPAKPDP